MIRSWHLSFVLLCAAGPLAASVPDAPAPLFEGRDLFGLQWATDPQIRPDGSSIAYVRNTYDVMTDRARPSIWLIDLASGTQRPLGGGAAASSPQWSPDGTRLAYVATVDG